MLIIKWGELADWDFEALNIELDGITDIDMEQFGFNIPDVECDAEAVEDDFDEEPPEEPKSKPGDIFKLGAHVLMCGDSTDVNSVEKLMGGR